MIGYLFFLALQPISRKTECQTKEWFYFSSVASQTLNTLLPDFDWILSLFFTTTPFFARKSNQKSVTALLK